MKNLIRFVLICFVFNLAACSQSEAEVKVAGGNLTYSGKDGQGFQPTGGTVILKNVRNETVADGTLIPLGQFLAVVAKKGAVFSHSPGTTKFAANIFPEKQPTEFASVEFTPPNRWILKDEKFRFLLKTGALTTTAFFAKPPSVSVMADASLARASVITLPKGIYQLWGYTITVRGDTATVTLANAQIKEKAGPISISSQTPTQPGNAIVSGVEVKFSQWTRRNRTEKGLDELRELILQPVKQAELKLGEKLRLMITYTEDGWVQIGRASGVDWELTYVLKDDQQKQVLRKEYKGTVKSEVGKVVENESGASVVFLGVSVKFKQVKADVAAKLKETPPFAAKRKP